MSLKSLQGTNEVINIRRLQVSSINGQPFNMGSGISTPYPLEAVLNEGNDADQLSIKNVNNLDVMNLDCFSINNIPYNGLPSLSDILENGIDAEDYSIANVNNLDVLTINNTLYNGSPTLSNVLSNGHDASSLSISNLNSLQSKSIIVSGDISANSINGNKMPSIQSGTTSTNIYPLTITFFPAFQSVPSVIAQPSIPSGYPMTSAYSANISNVTKTSFTIASVLGGSNIPVMWIAMT
jgi:hypothetical protein